MVRGRKLAEVSVNEKTGTAKLVTKDNDEIECPEAVHKVLSSKTVRNGFDELIYKPLASEGITSFSVEKNDHPVVIIDENEKKSFKSTRSLQKEERLIEVLTANVHISCVNFLATAISLYAPLRWRYFRFTLKQQRILTHDAVYAFGIDHRHVVSF
jgi:hypothetical protein